MKPKLSQLLKQDNVLVDAGQGWHVWNLAENDISYARVKDWLTGRWPSAFEYYSDQLFQAVEDFGEHEFTGAEEASLIVLENVFQTIYVIAPNWWD